MDKDELYGVARAILSAFGGFMVGKGYLDSETAIALAGAGATVIAAVWSVKAKRAK
jgi:hypothetical protein